jgi:hypothetical protein
MEYAHSKLADTSIDGTGVLFISSDDGIKQYSENKENDAFFNEWYINAKKEDVPALFLSLESIAKANEYYETEFGKYSGSSMEYVDSLLKKYGYEKP